MKQELEKDTPRGKFNALVEDLGLVVTETSSDGWHLRFHRPEDGLLLWRARDSRRGCFIQTAYELSGMIVGHKSFVADHDYMTQLREAVQRPLNDYKEERA